MPRKTDKTWDNNVSVWAMCQTGCSLVILQCAREEYGSKIRLLQPLYFTHTTAWGAFIDYFTEYFLQIRCAPSSILWGGWPWGYIKFMCGFKNYGIKIKL